MLASATGVAFPRVVTEPPMTMTSRTQRARRGSTLVARARLVSGPRATMVNSPGDALMREMRKSTARRSGTGRVPDRWVSPRPSWPCTVEPWPWYGRTSGLSAPTATGMSAWPAISRIVSALRAHCSTPTLPRTMVSPSTRSSGEARASMMAIVSSIPGSVSMITRRTSAIRVLPVCHREAHLLPVIARPPRLSSRGPEGRGDLLEHVRHRERSEAISS